MKVRSLVVPEAFLLVFVISILSELSSPPEGHFLLAQKTLSSPPGPKLALEDVLNPEDSEWHHAQALQLVAAGNEAAAQLHFRKAWERSPTVEKYVQDLTYSYINSGQYDNALEVIKDYVGRRGATALSWHLQGEWLFAQKLYQPAFESLRRSLEISNANYRAHQIIGLIYIVGRRELDALEELQISAQQNPNSAQVRFFLGRIYYKRGQPSRARDEFLACLRIQPAYPKATENLGLCYEAMQDIPKAIDTYEQALVLDRTAKTPPCEDPYIEYGVLMAKQGEIEKSVSLLKEGLQKNPRSARANFELGKVLFKTGQLEDAEKLLLDSANLDPNFSQPHFFLGKLYQKKKRSKEADVHWSLFKKLDSNSENREVKITR